jgi:hypothetical protein
LRWGRTHAQRIRKPSETEETHVHVAGIRTYSLTPLSASVGGPDECRPRSRRIHTSVQRKEGAGAAADSYINPRGVQPLSFSAECIESSGQFGCRPRLKTCQGPATQIAETAICEACSSP